MIEIKFHNKKYTKEFSLAPSNLLSNPRLRVLDTFTKKTGIDFSGKILDAGCGNGYAGISLALNSPVKSVVCLDNSDIAIEKLIPRNANYYAVGHKIDPVLGDFSDISYNGLIIEKLIRTHIFVGPELLRQITNEPLQLLALLCRIVPIDIYFAITLVENTAHNTHQGGFTSSIGAKQTNHPRIKFQGNTFERLKGFFGRP